MQSTVTHLAETEDLLQHQYRMLALGPIFRFGPVLRTLSFTQRMIENSKDKRYFSITRPVFGCFPA